MPRVVHERYMFGVIRPVGRMFEAEWNRGKKRRVRERFPTKADAQNWLDEQYTAWHRVIRRPSSKVIYEAQHAIDILPRGVSLIEAANEYVRLHQSVTRCNLLDAVNRFLEEKKATGLRDTTFSEYERMLGKLTAELPRVTVDEVTADALSKIIPGRGWCRDGYRRVWGALFAWALKREYCRKNPALGISKSRVTESEVKAWTPPEAQTILSATAASCPELVPYVAIGMFAGLRTTELDQLTWDDVDLAERWIRVRSAVAKTRRSRLVPIADNLHAILSARKHAEASGCRIKPCSTSTMVKRRADIIKDAGEAHRFAGAVWPDNAMRHSYCTYRLAAVQDAAKVALESGHTQSVLFRHYRELATPKDGAAYFRISV